MNKPHRYAFSSRHDYKEGITAWIKKWRLWRNERKRAKKKGKNR